MADFDNPRPSSQPEGSTDLVVAKDNLILLDKIAVSEESSFLNRKGQVRKTLAGIDEAVTIAISSAGYQIVGDFADIPKTEITAENQVYTSRSVAGYEGYVWRTNQTLSYTPTGADPTQAPELGKWDAVAIGELQTIARSLNVSDTDVIYDTDSASAIPDYIYSASQQRVYSVPLAAKGKFIDNVAGDQLTTTEPATYTLKTINKSGVEFETIDDIDDENSIGGKVSLLIGDSVVALDYATGNNSGLLFFKVVAAGTGVDDGGKYIDLPTLGLQLEQNMKLTPHVADWGAKGNAVDSDTTAVNNAITYVSSNDGGFLDFKSIYAGGGGFVLKTDVILRGQGLDKSKIGSLSGWSGNILETYDFAALEAADTADTDDGCPVSYGAINCVVDGDGYDGTVSDTQGYGVRLYGRKLVLQNLIIGRVAGIGLYTSFPAVPSYTSFDSITDTKYSVIRDIEITETGYEGFVFNGPTDQLLHNIFVGYPAGSRFDSYDTTGPKTSLLFPGEQIHGFRVLRSCEIGFVHSFDNEYGFAVYVKRQAGDPAVRLYGKYLMGENAYGGVFIDSNVKGKINFIETHNNSRGPTTGGAYSASAGLNAHFDCQSDLGFVAEVVSERLNDEQGSTAWDLSGINLDINGQIKAFDTSFAGGGIGVKNDCAASAIKALIASKSGAETLDKGFENASTETNNDLDISANSCDVNIDLLGGAGADTGTRYKMRTRSAGTTEINNLARLGQEPYLAADIITDDGNKRRNKFIGSVAVDFSITGLQTLSIPYGNWLVRDPLEDEVRITLSYDTGTMPPVTKFAVSNIDTVSKEIDVFIEVTGGAAGTGKINAKVG